MKVYIKVYLAFIISLIILSISCTSLLIRSKCKAKCPANFHREDFYPYSGKYCNCVYDTKECPKSLYKNAKIVESKYDKNTKEWGKCNISLCENGYKLMNGSCIKMDIGDCTSSDPDSISATKKWIGNNWGNCEIKGCKHGYELKNNKCIPKDEIQCSSINNNNVLSATRKYNKNEDKFDECLIRKCKENNVIIDNKCVLNLISKNINEWHYDSFNIVPGSFVTINKNLPDVLLNHGFDNYVNIINNFPLFYLYSLENNLIENLTLGNKYSLIMYVKTRCNTLKIWPFIGFPCTTQNINMCTQYINSDNKLGERNVNNKKSININNWTMLEWNFIFNTNINNFKANTIGLCLDSGLNKDLISISNIILRKI